MADLMYYIDAIILLSSKRERWFPFLIVKNCNIFNSRIPQNY